MGWIGAISEGWEGVFLAEPCHSLKALPAPSQLWSRILNTGQGGQQSSAPRTAASGGGGAEWQGTCLSAATFSRGPLTGNLSFDHKPRLPSSSLKRK